MTALRLVWWIFAILVLGSVPGLGAQEPWQEVLTKMPLITSANHLDRSNCVPVMLASFQSNRVAKGLIFLPGATDEFYFFRRANAVLTNNHPTLLDAVTVLTNQTLIRCTFREPFILLYSGEDALDRINRVEDEATAARIRKHRFPSPTVFNDRDWNSLHRPLSFHLDTRFLPLPNSHASNHFYRHSLAAFGLTTMELIDALSYAGKTAYIIQKRKVLFQLDERFTERPVAPSFP